MRDRVFITKRGTKITYQADFSGEMVVEISFPDGWMFEKKVEKEPLYAYTSIGRGAPDYIETRQSVFLTLPIDEILEFVNHLLENYTNSQFEFIRGGIRRKQEERIIENLAKNKALKSLVEISDDNKRALAWEEELEFPPYFEEKADELTKNTVKGLTGTKKEPVEEKKNKETLPENPRRKRREL